VGCRSLHLVSPQLNDFGAVCIRKRGVVRHANIEKFISVSLPGQNSGGGRGPKCCCLSPEGLEVDKLKAEATVRFLMKGQRATSPQVIGSMIFTVLATGKDLPRKKCQL